MFGDIALRLIKAMGSSGEIPSAIMAADIPAALARIKAALAAETIDDASTDGPADTDDAEPKVSLDHRAVPLIQMLEAALRGESYVMWEN